MSNKDSGNPHSSSEFSGRNQVEDFDDDYAILMYETKDAFIHSKNLRTKLKASKENLRIKTNDFTELQKRYDGLLKEKNDLEEAMQLTNGKAGNSKLKLESQVRELMNENKHLQSQCDELERLRRTANMHEQVKATNDSELFIQKKMMDIENRLSELTLENETLTRQCELLEKVEEKERVKDLEEELQHKSTQLRLLRQQFYETVTEKESLEQHLLALMTEKQQNATTQPEKFKQHLEKSIGEEINEVENFDVVQMSTQLKAIEEELQTKIVEQIELQGKCNQFCQEKDELERSLATLTSAFHIEEDLFQQKIKYLEQEANDALQKNNYFDSLSKELKRRTDELSEMENMYEQVCEEKVNLEKNMAASFVQERDAKIKFQLKIKNLEEEKRKVVDENKQLKLTEGKLEVKTEELREMELQYKSRLQEKNEIEKYLAASQEEQQMQTAVLNKQVEEAEANVRKLSEQNDWLLGHSEELKSLCHKWMKKSHQIRSRSQKTTKDELTSTESLQLLDEKLEKKMEEELDLVAAKLQWKTDQYNELEARYEETLQEKVNLERTLAASNTEHQVEGTALHQKIKDTEEQVKKLSQQNDWLIGHSEELKLLCKRWKKKTIDGKKSNAENEKEDKMTSTASIEYIQSDKILEEQLLEKSHALNELQTQLAEVLREKDDLRKELKIIESEKDGAEERITTLKENISSLTHQNEWLQSNSKELKLTCNKWKKLVLNKRLNKKDAAAGTVSASNHEESINQEKHLEGTFQNKATGKKYQAVKNLTIEKAIKTSPSNNEEQNPEEEQDENLNTMQEKLLQKQSLVEDLERRCEQMAKDKCDLQQLVDSVNAERTQEKITLTKKIAKTEEQLIDVTNQSDFFAGKSEELKSLCRKWKAKAITGKSRRMSDQKTSTIDENADETLKLEVLDESAELIDNAEGQEVEEKPEEPNEQEEVPKKVVETASINLQIDLVKALRYKNDCSVQVLVRHCHDFAHRNACALQNVCDDYKNIERKLNSWMECYMVLKRKNETGEENHQRQLKKSNEMEDTYKQQIKDLCEMVRQLTDEVNEAREKLQLYEASFHNAVTNVKKLDSQFELILKLSHQKVEVTEGKVRDLIARCKQLNERSKVQKKKTPTRRFSKGLFRLKRRLSESNESLQDV